MKIIWSACRQCDFARVERIPRRWWMRLLPRLRHYYCGDCQSAFLAPKDLVESRKWMMSTFRNPSAQEGGTSSDRERPSAG